MPVRILALVLAAALLSACDPPGAAAPDGGPVESTAGDLADALSAGDVASLSFDGLDGTVAQRRLVVLAEGMDAAPAEVAVADVVTSNDSGAAATATLDWTWDIAGNEWTYQSTADLTRSGDTWQVVWAPSLVEPSLVRGETLVLSAVEAQRGDITGSDGVSLVTDRPVVRFGIDKSRVGPARAALSAASLASLLDIEAAPFVKQVRAAGGQAFVEALVLRRGEVPRELGASYDDFAGALAVPDELPLAPTREFAAPVLGSVGAVTAETIEDSDGAYESGDEAGLSGLQARYDAELTGTDGPVVAALTPGGIERELFAVDPVDGESLATTLDRNFQSQAESALAAIAPASALVAIRPSTGDIVAAASGPGSAGYNTATFGQYAPGSTFKVVSALALLRSGLDPETQIPCTSTLVVDGKSFKNYDDYPPGALGDIALRSALANSCNTAFISQRDRLDETTLDGAAAALGLGVDHDLGFPAYFGSAPPAASATEGAADMIGQGKILASPMAMAAVVASVVRGQTVVPRLLPDVPSDENSPAVPLSASEAEALRAMMRDVVTVGSGAFLGDLPGPPVLAKTGTAEFGTAEPLRTHTWMVAAQGDLAVAVFVEVGESGSQTAGPILERFLRRVS